MKAKVSLFHPVVQPDGSVIRRKIANYSLLNPPDGVTVIHNVSPDVILDPVEKLWIDHYQDLYESGLFSLENTCLDLNLPLP